VVEIIPYNMGHLLINENEVRAVSSYTVRDVRLRKPKRQDSYASSLLEEFQYFQYWMQHSVPRLLVL
jgi:hypothetical protein